MTSIWKRLIEGVVGVIIGFGIYFQVELMLYTAMIAGNIGGLGFTVLSLAVLLIFLAPIIYFIKRVRNEE